MYPGPRISSLGYESNVHIFSQVLVVGAGIPSYSNDDHYVSESSNCALTLFRGTIVNII